jgi:ABC-type arginine transport system permease subunit
LFIPSGVFEHGRQAGLSDRPLFSRLVMPAFIDVAARGRGMARFSRLHLSSKADVNASGVMAMCTVSSDEMKQCWDPVARWCQF